jgi:hypothetical protein
MKMLRVGGIIFGLFLGAAGSASASTLDYTYSFSGVGFTGNGQIIVNSTTDVVQALSGTVNGASVQLIAANSSNLYTQPGTGLQWTYDDLYFKSGTPFDNEGLLFNFGKNGVGNLYSIGSQLYLSVSNPIGDFNPGVKVSVSVSQTPLPSGLPLFLTALIGLWFLLSRKSRKISDRSVAFGQLGRT